MKEKKVRVHKEIKSNCKIEYGLVWEDKPEKVVEKYDYNQNDFSNWKTLEL